MPAPKAPNANMLPVTPSPTAAASAGLRGLRGLPGRRLAEGAPGDGRWPVVPGPVPAVPVAVAPLARGPPLPLVPLGPVLPPLLGLTGMGDPPVPVSTPPPMGALSDPPSPGSPAPEIPFPLPEGAPEGDGCSKGRPPPVPKSPGTATLGLPTLPELGEPPPGPPKLLVPLPNGPLGPEKPGLGAGPRPPGKPSGPPNCPG